MASNSSQLGQSDNQFFTFALLFEGIVGTFFSLYSMRRAFGTANRNPAALFCKSLSVADFGIVILCPVSAYAFWRGRGWPYGDTGCEIYGMLAMLFGCASIWSAAMVAIFNAMSVVATSQQDKAKVEGTAFKLLVFTWLNALIWAASPIGSIGWGSYVPESYGAGCLFKFGPPGVEYYTYLFAFVTFTFILPVAALLWVAYMSMTENETQRMAAQFCIVVTVSLWGCWGMYAFKAFSTFFDDETNFPVRLAAVAPTLAKFCPIVNAMFVRFFFNDQSGSISKDKKAAEGKQK